MSHFSVLVIGDDVAKALEPYQENNMETTPKKYLEFNAVEDEYREQYENETRSEFYSGNSLYLPKEVFDKLSNKNVGETFTFDVADHDTGIGSYFKLGDKKQAEYRDADRNSSGRDDNIWYEVESILDNGGHPNSDVCFNGRVRVKRIDPPKEIPLKDYYDSFEDFISGWAGYDEKDSETGEYGYWHNPNAKWDWFQVGGRYRDRLKLKEGADGDKGFGQERYVGSLYRESTEGYCDSALKGDIDWDAIHGDEESYNEAIRFWEMKVEGAEPKTEDEENQLRWDWYKEGYYEERYGDKETFAKCRANFTTWAIITEDGEWIEKGDMGWWGMSGESHDEALQWELHFFDKFVKPLSDDTRLTIVDCHI